MQAIIPGYYMNQLILMTVPELFLYYILILITLFYTFGKRIIKKINAERETFTGLAKNAESQRIELYNGQACCKGESSSYNMQQR
jgi:hypothetical protein